MFMIHHQLARSLTDERLAKAEEARALQEYRRQRKNERRTVIDKPDAEVIELTFGSHCETDQIGA